MNRTPMDDAISLEAEAEEGLVTKKKNKFSLWQKLQRKLVSMVQPLRASIGLRRNPRACFWSRQKLHSRHESSDHWHFFPDKNRLQNGNNVQHSHLQFHFPHPKIRVQFHVPCVLHSHPHSHPRPHRFHSQNSSNEQKENSHSLSLPNDVPKGFLAVYVGEEHQRFVIPVFYLNHPLFGELLKGTQEEYGFEQKGALFIPCEVSDFELLRSRIGRKQSCKSRRRQCGTDGYQEEHGHVQRFLPMNCRGALHSSGRGKPRMKQFSCS